MSVGIWPTGDGRWCVVGTLAWECGRPGSNHWIAVPDGFVTDLASVPRWKAKAFFLAVLLASTD